MSSGKNWADIVPLFRSLFVITDPGRDQDDEDVLVMLNRFVRLGILDMLGTVANLAPAAKRAQLAKGTMDALGMADIPVGIGSNCLQPEDDGLKYQFAVTYLAEQRTFEHGKNLIERALREARPKGVVLLLISGLTDAANALAHDHELFTEKVRRVVIMGGVQAKDHRPVLDENGYFLPDLTAQNHTFDLDATKFLYRGLQMLGIPMTVVSRHPAVAAKVPRSVYDDMADTGHVIGKRLRDAQMLAIEHLWKRACMPAGAPERMGLPERCNADWFRNTFCGGKGAGRTAGDSIWDIVETFNLYDPVTLVAAIPTLREHFFSPYVAEVNGVEHHLIGLDAERHGVNDIKALAEYLRRIMLESLMQSMPAEAMTG